MQSMECPEKDGLEYRQDFRHSSRPASPSAARNASSRSPKHPSAPEDRRRAPPLRPTLPPASISERRSATRDRIDRPAVGNKEHPIEAPVRKEKRSGRLRRIRSRGE